jgi:hypothetical protein
LVGCPVLQRVQPGDQHAQPELEPHLAVTGGQERGHRLDQREAVLGQGAEYTSGVLNALQQLGGTIGVAVTGTLFFELLPDGPVRAMQITTIVAAGFLVDALVLVRLLPKRPRLDQAH